MQLRMLSDFSAGNQCIVRHSCMVLLAACDWNSEWVEVESLSLVAAKGDECKQFKGMRNSISN